MVRYVIAGATGQVGSVVASQLLAQGEPIKVIVRDSGKGIAWSGRGAEVAEGSLEDRAFLCEALRGAAGFFTLLPPILSNEDLYSAQRRVADSIAAGVKESGVPHVVMLSSIGADLDEGTGPIKGLHYLENAIRASGTKLTAIRSTYFQENIASAVPVAEQFGVYPNFLPSADFAMPMVATRDIGRLAAKLLQHSPPRSDVVYLAGPTYSVRQLAEKLGEAMGKKLLINNIPAPNQVATLTQAGLPLSMAEAIAEMYAALGAGRITPKADRTENGTTTIDEVLPTLVPA